MSEQNSVLVEDDISMKYFLILLKTLAVWAGLLFCWFLISGTPFFNNPGEIDGKGPPIANHACHYKGGLGYCSETDYWAQAPQTAVFLTIGTILQPIAFVGWLSTLPYALPYYLLPIPIFLFFSYNARKRSPASQINPN